jgi:hypothetical protein
VTARWRSSCRLLASSACLAGHTTLAADELDVILRQALWGVLVSDRRAPTVMRPSDD